MQSSAKKHRRTILPGAWKTPAIRLSCTSLPIFRMQADLTCTTLAAVKFLKRISFTAFSCLSCIPAVPELLLEQISDFKHVFISIWLHSKACLPNHDTTGFRYDRPQAKSIVPISSDLPVKPLLDIRVGKIMFIGIHHLRILQHLRQIKKIILIHFSESQTFCLENHRTACPQCHCSHLFF